MDFDIDSLYRMNNPFSALESNIRSMMAIPTILLIVFIVSLITAIVLLAAFLPKKKQYQYRGFLKSAYNFLNFNTFWISPIIKLLYMTFAFTLVLGGFIILFIQPLFGLGLIITGIFIRLLFETGYILYSIFDQLSQINGKMGPGGLTPSAQPAPKAPEFCPQCGKVKDPTEAFCQKCGYKY